MLKSGLNRRPYDPFNTEEVFKDKYIEQIVASLSQEQYEWDKAYAALPWWRKALAILEGGRRR